MANVLKAQRTVAKQKFTRTEKSLDTAITTDGTPLQTIVRKFGDFKKVFETLRMLMMPMWLHWVR